MWLRWRCGCGSTVARVAPTPSKQHRFRREDDRSRAILNRTATAPHEIRIACWTDRLVKQHVPSTSHSRPSPHRTAATRLPNRLRPAEQREAGLVHHRTRGPTRFASLRSANHRQTRFARLTSRSFAPLTKTSHGVVARPRVRGSRHRRSPVPRCSLASLARVAHSAHATTRAGA